MGYFLLLIPVLLAYFFPDIDECMIGNGNCHHRCNNTIGDYNCTCEDGYRLLSDLHTCEGDELHDHTTTVPKSGI